MDFIPWVLSTISLHGKISPNFRVKFCVSLSKGKKKNLNNNIIFLKSMYCCPKWKNTLKLQKIKI